MAKKSPRPKDPASPAENVVQREGVQPAKPRRVRAAGAALPPETLEDASSPTTRAESMSSAPSDEDIRMRAYQRYQERGGRHGSDFDDWLEAERELKGR